MDYRINFDEPIPEMIERLKREHIDFRSSLDKIEQHIRENETKRATETTRNMSERIIKHAVEEEARIIRVIMQNAKEESADSIKIMQEHNWVVEFLKHKLQNMENDDHQQDRHDEQHQQKVQNDINEFVGNMRNHFLEEEQIVFPLALKAETGQTK